MNIGKAWAIFENINSADFSIDEKWEAICEVADAPTHNSITKAKILEVLRWVVGEVEVTEE